MWLIIIEILTCNLGLRGLEDKNVWESCYLGKVIFFMQINSVPGISPIGFSVKCSVLLGAEFTAGLGAWFTAEEAGFVTEEAGFTTEAASRWSSADDGGNEGRF